MFPDGVLPARGVVDSVEFGFSGWLSSGCRFSGRLKVGTPGSTFSESARPGSSDIAELGVSGIVELDLTGLVG